MKKFSHKWLSMKCVFLQINQECFLAMSEIILNMKILGMLHKFNIITTSISIILSLIERLKKLPGNTKKRTKIHDCERTEHPSQSYGTPKKRNKIHNISHRTILCKTFFYSFSIMNWSQTWTGLARTGLAWHFGLAFQKPISPFLWEIRVFALNRT